MGVDVAGQSDDPSARGEGVDLFRVEIDLERRHELGWVVHIVLPFDQLAQPAYALVVRRRAVPALLVFPVRGDALFGHPVHLLGANLHFEGEAARADHGGVEGLIQDWAAGWR